MHHAFSACSAIFATMLLLLTARTAVSAEPPPWPADETSVLFCYRSPRNIIAFAADGTRQQSYGVVPSDFKAFGFTYPEAGGGLVLMRGRYQAKGVEAFLAKRLAEAPALTLEALFTPAGPTAAPGVIAAIAGAAGNDLALVQGPDGLAVELRGTQPQRHLLAVATTAATHVVTTVTDGRLLAWVDGVAQPAQPAVLARQAEPTVLVGADHDGTRPWAGTLHALAIYARPVDAVAHLTALRQRLAARPAIPRTSVEVEAVEVSSTPSPNAIAPYYRGLVVCSHRVLRVRAGPTPRNAVIKIAHWGVMGGVTLAVKGLKPGDRQLLVIEAMDAHPYLKPEHTSENLDGDLDAPLFYEISGWSIRTALTATAAKP